MDERRVVLDLRLPPDRAARGAGLPLDVPATEQGTNSTTYPLGVAGVDALEDDRDVSPGRSATISRDGVRASLAHVLEKEESVMDEELELLLAERAIERVLCTYSRAADRFDLELMRSCYWPDGTDDHGSYDGGLDGFIEFVGPALQRFERTNHFLGNMLIDVDLVDEVARAETYVVAYHRFHDPDGRENDMVAGLRYVDRFERRDGGWRIGRRVCVFEWRRTDPVGDGSSFADTYARGIRGPDDIVWHILE